MLGREQRKGLLALWGWGFRGSFHLVSPPPIHSPRTLGQSGVLSVKTAGLTPLPFYRGGS